MNAQLFSFSSVGHKKIYAQKWVHSTSEPLAIVQVAHGMAEHIQRYDDFAQHLLKHHIFTYGNDHRGHGQTAQSDSERGFFADNNGFDTVVNDMKVLTSCIKKEYPNVPIIMFGHSMGSFLLRHYLTLYGEAIQGAIICGTGGKLGILGKIGKLIAKNEVRQKGPRSLSPRMNQLIFSNYNRKVTAQKTEFDWLSRDDEAVKKYIEDPHCGGIFTTSFYYDLLHGLDRISRRSHFEQTPKNVPLLFICGDKDPVGQYSKGVTDVVHRYKKAGVEECTLKIYKDARHELLNETNKADVYDDVVQWVKHVVSAH